MPTGTKPESEPAETSDGRWLQSLDKMGAPQVRLMLELNQIAPKRVAATMAWLGEHG